MAKGKFTGFGGGGGGMNMNNLMKQAQKMKEDMARLEEEISLKEVESTAGGGAVAAIVGVIMAFFGFRVLLMTQLEKKG